MLDQLGNSVNVGDLMHLKVGTEWVIGTVLKLQNGGIAVGASMPRPGQPQPVTPDVITLQITIGFNQQPGTPLQGAIKCEQPMDAGPKLVQ